MKEKLLSMNLFPPGAAASRKWLLEQGVQGYTIDNYLRSGKLELLQKGIYCWKGFDLKWQALVASLPRVESDDLHIGGVTALNMQGAGHYLQMSSDISLSLYSHQTVSKRIEKLFSTSVDVTPLFFTSGSIWNKNTSFNFGLIEWKDPAWDEAFYLSTIERAILEVLHITPKYFSFNQADELFQGLTTLSPRRLKTLLTSCKSIKVKRLFFWFADRYKYSWLKHLNTEDYDLGSGKRSLVEGGVLDKKYLITLPRDLTEREFNG